MSDKLLFDKVCNQASVMVTKNYSTSFSSAVRMLSTEIRQDIYNIYGFVRFADEIVDTFLDSNQEYLLNKFEEDMQEALDLRISLNPILNAFQATVHKYKIDMDLIDAFISSMRKDLHQEVYSSVEDYKQYIYGSADVVGLMCLKVFVHGDEESYQELKPFAMKLGSAFQKVNFLRDIKSDREVLNRSYFPNVNVGQLNEEDKKMIVREIKEDFEVALLGIKRLPLSAKFGVYTAYLYYVKLLKKLEKTPSESLMKKRIRVSNPIKIGLMTKSFIDYKFKLI